MRNGHTCIHTYGVHMPVHVCMYVCMSISHGLHLSSMSIILHPQYAYILYICIFRKVYSSNVCIFSKVPQRWPCQCMFTHTQYTYFHAYTHIRNAHCINYSGLVSECLHTYIHTYTHTHINTCTHIRIVYPSNYSSRVFAYLPTYTHTHIHTYTHQYVYTH